MPIIQCGSAGMVKSLRGGGLMGDDYIMEVLASEGIDVGLGMRPIWFS